MLTQFQKKAFLYFGGAFIIILGGAIILTSPYHAVGYVAFEGEDYTFEIWEGSGFYPELELKVSSRGENVTFAAIHITIMDNYTLETQTLNISLNEDNQLPGSNPPVFENTTFLALEYSAYTISIDRTINVGLLDLGFTQVTDSRNFIVLGGSMNIIGLVMGCSGYCVAGSLIPSGDEAIVKWGFEEEDS
ncbi:MAG: hypothetical protein RTU30_05215 [Candidatus Thorarchaeota archaeon]